MLTDFFKLNSPFSTFSTEHQLTSLLKNSNDLRNVLFGAPTLAPNRPDNRFIGKSFTNVSFSKTKISGVEFRSCKFEDCLFIGTHFIDCEFHDCTFVGCNPHKVVFENTYVDPAMFEGLLNPIAHSNIGMHLFQQLYENSMAMRQREFANVAEFNRSKWRRYVLNYKYPGQKKFDRKYIRSWLANYLSYIIAGYGIRIRFLAVWALIVGAGSLAVNFTFWDTLRFVGRDGPLKRRDFVEVFYYTFTIPVGVGDLTPTSDAGMLIFAGEAASGLVIVSFFVTWLVKRAIR